MADFNILKETLTADQVIEIGNLGYEEASKCSHVLAHRFAV